MDLARVNLSNGLTKLPHLVDLSLDAHWRLNMDFPLGMVGRYGGLDSLSKLTKLESLTLGMHMLQHQHPGVVSTFLKPTVLPESLQTLTLYHCHGCENKRFQNPFTNSTGFIAALAAAKASGRFSHLRAVHFAADLSECSQSLDVMELYYNHVAAGGNAERRLSALFGDSRSVFEQFGVQFTVQDTRAFRCAGPPDLVRGDTRRLTPLTWIFAIAYILWLSCKLLGLIVCAKIRSWQPWERILALFQVHSS